MPFTISHAAAALPLQRLTKGQLPLSALMIGAMSPDFAYFLSFAANRMVTHDFVGLFTFCWPVGLAVWLLFVRVLEQPTVALLPEPWRSRFTREREVINFRTLMFASMGILLGALSHLTWDAFTHSNTVVTDIFPVFHARLFEIAGVKVRVFWLLQVLSSLFGAIVLMAWAWRTPASSKPATRRANCHEASISNQARVGAALSILVTSALVGVMGYFDHPHADFEGRLFFVLIGGMKGFAIAWAAVAAFTHQYLRVLRLRVPDRFTVSGAPFA